MCGVTVNGFIDSVTSDYGALSIPPQKKNIEYGEVRWYVLMVPKEMGMELLRCHIPPNNLSLA